MKLDATNPIYWGLGGLLLCYGLTRQAPRGALAATAGVFLLAVKAAEGLSRLTRREASQAAGVAAT